VDFVEPFSVGESPRLRCVCCKRGFPNSMLAASRSRVAERK